MAGRGFPKYEAGTFLRVCDRSGQIFRDYDTREEWTGLYVGADFYEDRQPQDLVRGVMDDPRVGVDRPRSQAVFVPGANTTLTNASGIPVTTIPPPEL